MKNQTAAIISVVAVAVIIVSGFAPIITALNVKYIPQVVTKTTAIPYTAVQTTQSASISTYTTVLTEQSVTTETNQVFNMGAYTLSCGNWYYQSSYIGSGSDVQFSFSAANPIYVYVFNSAEYASFNSSQGNTSPNLAEIDSKASGSGSFHVSQSDNYYLVLYQKPGFFGCIGYANIGVYGASGTATFATTVNYYVTQTNTQVYYVPVTTTVTFYSQSSYATTVTSTTTKTCQVGWLQDILLGCP